MSKFLLSAVLIMLVAAAFTTIGMAYTASTDNSGNDVSSDYVVLEQTNYTFTSGNGLKFDILTTSNGTVYQLYGTKTLSIPVDQSVRDYAGIQIGSQDTLKATEVNTQMGSIGVYVTTFSAGLSTGFKDFSGDELGWRYVLEVIGPDPDSENPLQTLTQYAVYDGAAPSGSDIVEWDCYYVDNGDLVQSENNCLSIKTNSDPAYTTKLYFFGPKTSSNPLMAESPSRPDTNGSIISDGTIKFIYRSEGGNPE